MKNKKLGFHSPAYFCDKHRALFFRSHMKWIYDFPNGIFELNKRESIICIKCPKCKDGKSKK